MRYFIVSDEELEEYLWLLEHDENTDNKGEYWSLATNTVFELEEKDLIEVTKDEYSYILNKEADEDLYLVDEREALLERYS